MKKITLIAMVGALLSGVACTSDGGSDKKSENFIGRQRLP